MTKAPIVRLTDKLSDAISKLYKTGGFALAFGFAGIILMLGANIFGGELAIYLLIIGAVLTFLCLGFFLYTTLKQNSVAKKVLIDNKETIDTIQDISLELIKMVNTLQSYCFKNIGKIDEALQRLIPVLSSFPLLGDKLKDYGLSNLSVISTTIVENTDKVEKVVSDLEEAILTADSKKLNQYSKELSSLVVLLKKSLKE
jgi:hypothetical protein